MQLSPTGFDIWLASKLGECLNRFPLFDECIQSGLRHYVLGGFWYAGAMFVFWVQAARLGEHEKRLRIITTIVGSAITILLALLAGMVLTWPPPIRNAELAHFFPPYIEPNLNASSFPSVSTALYGSVAAGIYSIHRTTGLVLWVALPLLVSLPRMYVGGHWFSDIIAGLILALIGYALARYLLEPPLLARLETILANNRRWMIVTELLVFAWIFEVAVEFREGVWLVRAFEIFTH
ncbi:MAG: phosphatase PAP2 family protein [Acidobacteriia bacterium]|nr:phosphatase PAP2 family protein [Terriglobia bacterium]